MSLTVEQCEAIAWDRLPNPYSYNEKIIHIDVSDYDENVVIFQKQFNPKASVKVTIHRFAFFQYHSPISQKLKWVPLTDENLGFCSVSIDSLYL